MANKDEIWKPIPGFDGYYVSNLARVRSDKLRKVILAQRIYGGYLWVGMIDNDGKNRLRVVHRLVADAFIPNPENKPEIDHINTIRNDNRIENLRWVTHSENCRNELSLERYRKRKGENSPRYGKKASDETKAKLRASHFGKRFSEEYKAKLREDYATGKRVIVNKRPVALYDKNDNIIKIWDSARDASREFGISPSNICWHLKNNIPNRNGESWKYYEKG